jgi:hypothetical protein
MKLSFYTPIAYDYKYAFASILSYYQIADEIILAIDKEHISWANKKYAFDTEYFLSRLQKIDIDQKITLFEENFHLYEPLKNDTYERNRISMICKKDNYIVGIDSDEILLNSQEFYEWMNTNNPQEDICCHWFSVYKAFGDKYLITLPNETTVIGTNLRNTFRKCRFTLLKNVLTPLKVLHFSWGRKRNEIEQKLLNWSHTQDFDTQKYLETWDSVNLSNYETKVNLHPLNLKQWWQKLELVELESFGLSEQLLKEVRLIQE